LGSSVPEAGSWVATFIGHSMGGYVALAFAEKYPEFLKAVGLFHSTAFADTEEKKETRRKGISFIQQHGGPEFLKTTIPNLYAPVTKEVRPELIEQQLAGVNNFSGEALVRYYEAMMQRPDRTEVLRNSKVPVLFIMGRFDTAVPLEDMLKQCHLPKVSYIHILERSGHNGMIEEGPESNKNLSDFITTIEMSTYTG
jgi:pimeloyl-ACP methyl ester carboxylesterase